MDRPRCVSDATQVADEPRPASPAVAEKDGKLGRSDRAMTGIKN
jgi:hypothetical protein